MNSTTKSRNGTPVLKGEMMANIINIKDENEWLNKALECYENEKSHNPDYLAFDDSTIKTFARRIVGQIKAQMKLDNEQCKLLLIAIFGGKK